MQHENDKVDPEFSIFHNDFSYIDIHSQVLYITHQMIEWKFSVLLLKSEDDACMVGKGLLGDSLSPPESSHFIMPTGADNHQPLTRITP